MYQVQNGKTKMWEPVKHWWLKGSYMILTGMNESARRDLRHCPPEDGRLLNILKDDSRGCSFIWCIKSRGFLPGFHVLRRLCCLSPSQAFLSEHS